ncbi:MAG: ABC transporter permease [Proteobacteria bacterium]|nr:ABC transporter permease [Pseudomonadota bacterium]
MSEAYTKVIKADSNWMSFDFRSVFYYRDLLFLMIRREFVSKYKQTILGPLWFVIQPVLMAIVFVFLFSETMHVPTDGIPPVLFYFSGIIIWNFLSSSLGAISLSMLHHSELCKKVYFPRIFLPISQLFASFFALLIQTGVFIFLYLLFWITQNHSGFFPTPQLLFLPLWVFQLALLSLGVGTWIAGLTTRYRDFHHLTQLGLTLWMYASPISYSLRLVSPKWKWLVLSNPVSPVILSIRAAVFGTEALSLQVQLVSMGISIFLCVTGILFFNRIQRNFIDTR